MWLAGQSRFLRERSFVPLLINGMNWSAAALTCPPPPITDSYRDLVSGSSTASSPIAGRNAQIA